jgi:hypothetical protein
MIGETRASDVLYFKNSCAFAYPFFKFVNFFVFTEKHIGFLELIDGFKT